MVEKSLVPWHQGGEIGRQFPIRIHQAHAFVGLPCRRLANQIVDATIRAQWRSIQVPSRANVWALKELGVRRILAPIVCGALHLEYELGDIVVCDQFVDRTWGREDTYYTGPGTILVPAAQPFCDDLSTTVVRTARELDIPVHNGGTTVVVQGPRFSTTAESLFFHAMGWDTVNMVSYPESHLARELELCYANISIVTDHDVGIAGAGGVTSQTIDRVMDESMERLHTLIAAAIPRIGPQPDDECSTALARARL
jgi:5'-methylthioadenosine phosphorylase